MEINSYQIYDEQEILKLFKLSFGKEMSMDYWKWRFADNPFTENLFIDLMWSESELVGHYAVSPVEMLVDNEKVINTALSMTTMTHLEHGGKGIFSKLAVSLYDRLKSEKFEAVWGFPNNNSHYGFIKNLSWKNVAMIPFFSLSVENIILNKSNSVTITQHLNFDEVEDEIFITDSPLQINKTKKYLNWRYVSNPSFEYKIVQIENIVIVYKVIDSFTQSGKKEIDILEVSNGINENMLSEILNYLVEETQDCVKINIWKSIHEKEYLIWEKKGFRPGAPLTYLGYTSLNETCNDKFKFYQNWNVTLGHSDVF